MREGGLGTWFPGTWNYLILVGTMLTQYNGLVIINTFPWQSSIHIYVETVVVKTTNICFCSVFNVHY